jgi:hypothetical protein
MELPVATKTSKKILNLIAKGFGLSHSCSANERVITLKGKMAKRQIGYCKVCASLVWEGPIELAINSK